MNIPNGMSEDEVIDTINTVCNRIALDILFMVILLMT